MLGMPQYTDAGSIGFQVSGRFNLLSGSRDKFVSNNYQVQDHFSLVRGRHTMRFGFEYLHLSFFQAFLGPANFQFNGQRTGGGTGSKGDPLADFLLGTYQQVNVGNGVNVNDATTWYAALYYQDDFKVTTRLTLNIGLRYEIPNPSPYGRGSPPRVRLGHRSQQYRRLTLPSPRRGARHCRCGPPTRSAARVPARARRRAPARRGPRTSP